MTRNLPLGATLGGAVAFVPRALVGAWGVLLLLGALLAAPLWAPLTGGARPWLAALVVPALVVVGLMAEGALYRLGVGARGLGVGGLQFGKVELRLLGAGLLVALFLCVVLAAAAVTLVFVAHAAGLTEAGAAGFAQPGAARWKVVLLGGFAVGAAWILAQLCVRLSLYKAATVARGRTVSLDAMALAENNFWKLLAGLAVVTAPTWALVAWRAWRPEADQRLFVAVHAAVIALIQAPLAAGFLSEAYKRLEYWGEQRGSAHEDVFSGR